MKNLFVRCLLSFAAVLAAGSARAGPYDGEYESLVYNYAFRINGNQAVATRSNSTMFKEGQVMFTFNADAEGNFTGQQIFTDGNWYPVKGTFAGGEIEMFGRNFRWIMTPPQPRSGNPESTTIAQTLPQENSITLEDATARAKAMLEGRVATSGDFAGYVFPYQASSYKSQCVSLVKAFTPQVGATWKWKAGQSLSNFPELQPGTPVATFTDAGRYPQVFHFGSSQDPAHTGLFLGYVVDAKNKIIGMYLLDQYPGKRAGVTYYQYGHPGKRSSNAANYSVIGP